MPYQYLCSALQFMTMSPPICLLCERRSFFIRHFFQDISTVQIAGRVEDREGMLRYTGYSSNLASHFKAYGTGLILVSDQHVQLRKIFALFLKINALLKGFFTTDTKCTDVSLKPRVRRKTTEK